MTAKDLFRKADPGKESLAQWWAPISHDDRFLSTLTHVRAELMELRPTREQLDGAELVIATLLTLAENDAQMTTFPTPGLHHDFSDLNREQPTTEPAKV